MKKFFLGFFILIFFSMLTVYSKSDYSYLLDEDFYAVYRIKIDNLTTNNIFKYVDKLKIVNIYPSVNPIYKNQVGNIVYNVKSNNMEDEIKKFRDNYLKMIKKNNYADYNYLYTNGIDIEAIDVYINSYALYDFLNSEDVSAFDKISY